MLPNVPRTVLPTRRALGVTPHRTSFRCRNSSSNSISSIKMFDWKEVSHNRYVMICYNRLRSRASKPGKLPALESVSRSPARVCPVA